MAKKYKALLSPLKFENGTVIKNRMVFPNASPHFLQGPETYPSDEFRAFYTGLAQNGASIITLAEWSNPNQRNADFYFDFTHMQNFDYSDPSVANYFSQLADEIHFYGSKIMIGLGFPPFPEGYSLDGCTGTQHVFGPFGPPPATKPATKEMIRENIHQFVERCRMFRSCGYDGYSMRVEYRLANDFESLRDDEYDLSCMENRMRYVLECADAVKKEFPDWLIEFGIAGEQPFGYDGGRDGYDLKTGIEFAKLCEGHIDILQIREKDVCKSHPTGFTFHKGEHEVIRYARAMKDAGVTKLALQPIGGFQDPDEINGYLENGDCDLIGMARAFFADSEYYEKICEGRPEDITPCLWCNKCHGTILPDPDPWLSVCSVNPKFGLESRMNRLVRPVKKTKKVAVIGGGPAGLRTALFASERGHDVTIYEKRDSLGGQTFYGDYASFKWPIGDYKNWLVNQVKKQKIQVILNTVPTAEELQAKGYDAIIACTGAEPKIPSSLECMADKDGSLKPEYRFCLDVFGHEAELGKNVVIIGASETGVETGMYLAENGHDVTLLTRQKTIGHDCSRLHYITMSYVGDDPVTGQQGLRAAWEAYPNLRGITEATTKDVQGCTVTYESADGTQHEITADSIVLCGGMKPLTDEALSYADAADEFYMIGDCSKVRNLQKLNREAFAAAMRL